MNLKPRALVILAVAILAVLLGADPSVEERLAQHRNLGKAFYENPTTGKEAIAEFEKALQVAPNSNREKLNLGLALLRAGQSARAVELLRDVQRRDASLPHTWFNLGIYYKKSGDAPKALEQFERLAKIDPSEPIVHYQLGTLYKQVTRQQDAIAQFETAEKLNPSLAAPHFQLYNLYRQAGRKEEAARELALFQSLKDKAQGAAVPEDVDWCNYAEIYDPAVPPTPLPPVYATRIYQTRPLEGTVDTKTAGLTLIDSTGAGNIDLLAWSSKGIALYRQGFERVKDSGLDGVTGVIFVATGDYDNDGKMDLCVLTEAGPLLFHNTGGKFQRAAASLPKRRFERAVWIDYDHDYDLDLVLLGAESAAMRNQGTAGFVNDTAGIIPFVKGKPMDAYKLRATPDTKAFDLAVFYSDHAPVLYRDQLGHYTADKFDGQPRNLHEIEADFDGKGILNRVQVDPSGKLLLQENDTKPDRNWIRVQLAGVRSLKLAQDAEVEIKAGRLYRKKLYEGVPLVFDLDKYATADVVRITWPNGLIQNETQQVANHAYKYEEQQRLSGSCPMIWTWNGHGFEFITDVLGVAPLGASDGEGSYFPVDHDEYVSIPGAALKQRGGFYDVRITEELSEVSYIDQVQLLAIDHPADTQIFTNEKFKGPPYPEFRLFGVRQRVYPTAARDDAGRDVLPLLLKRDQRYPEQFARTESGVAELHTLELDFAGAAPSGRAVLLLNGWVDWPDGSTFRAVSQERKSGFIMPRLEMQDAHGKWQVVNPDMGMPAGKPKTIAVDLQFISASHKVRIVTNLCVYWDEIFLSEDTGAPSERHLAAPLVSADLHFRGFSESRIDRARKQPDTYSYANVSPTSFWNPTPGLYTRYGDVRPLLRDVDDMPVIMGSGDEITLRFDAARFPPLPHGWTRDYLLKVDGWAKDRDPNTAFSTSVEPLPFHGMSVYPYPAGEHFPDDEAHRRYRREYNTRPALRLIRPLAESN